MNAPDPPVREVVAPPPAVSVPPPTGPSEQAVTHPPPYGLPEDADDDEFEPL